MDVNYPKLPTTGENIVYVKSVPLSDLPEDVQIQAEGMDHLYSIHTADGERIALVANRNVAFALARENDLSPVAVH